MKPLHQQLVQNLDLISRVYDRLLRQIATLQFVILDEYESAQHCRCDIDKLLFGEASFLEHSFVVQAIQVLLEAFVEAVEPVGDSAELAAVQFFYLYQVEQVR